MQYFSNISIFKARLQRDVTRIFALVAIASTLFFIPISSALAAPPPTETAAALFTSNCAGCHAHGGNVVRRGKNLKLKALKRYGYDDVTKISQIITHGKGIMPAYGDRLTDEEIGAIAQYVKTQSESGWK